MRASLVALLALLAAPAALAFTAEAAYIVNTLSIPLQVSVDGTLFVVKSGSALPVTGGSQVCVEREVIYIGESTRLVFEGWLVDGRLEESGCINAPEADSKITPYYVAEYLITVYSSPPGVFEAKLWVKAGGELAVEIPLEVERDNARYVLSRVNGPGRLEGSTLYVPSSGPVTVELIYNAYYRVVVKLSEYGFGDEEYWLRFNAESLVRVPEEIEVGERAKLVLRDVEAVGANARLLGGGKIVVLPLQPGAEIYPIYEMYYLVKWRTLEGPKEAWVRHGDTITLKAQQRIPAAPDPERVAYVFQGWKGTFESSLPSVTILVNGPVDMEAVYKKQYKIVVQGPFEPVEYWVDEGGSFPIYQPEVIPGLILGRRLTGYIVGDQLIPPGPGGLLLLSGVNEPLVVVPVYEVTVLWGNVALLAGLVFAVVILYMGYDLFMTLREERRRMASGRENAEVATDS